MRTIADILESLIDLVLCALVLAGIIAFWVVIALAMAGA